MKQPLDITLSGIVDMHVHPSPCLFQRPYDDVEVAKMYASVGAKAILLKNHYEYTMSRAYHASKAVPEIQVFGGVVLNRYVGGINPLAAEFALRMGAKEVWMPNIDAAAHVEEYGAPGTYQKKGASSSLKPVQSSSRMLSGKPLSILSNGKLLDEAKEIVMLVKEHDAALGTSHLSKEEIYALVRFAKSEGFNKVVITHPYYRPPAFQMTELKPLVEQGATLEFSATISYPPASGTTIAAEAKTIREYGAEHCVVVSDAGAVPFPAPHEMLRVYAQGLFEAGITKDELKTMMIANPKRLLNLA